MQQKSCDFNERNWAFGSLEKNAKRVKKKLTRKKYMLLTTRKIKDSNKLTSYNKYLMILSDLTKVISKHLHKNQQCGRNKLKHLKLGNTQELVIVILEYFCQETS